MFSFGKGEKVRAELYIDFGRGSQAQNKRVFDRLVSDKTKIEAEYGAQLEWERLDNGQGSRIAIYRPGTIDDDRSLGELHKWAVEHLLKFKTVFGSRLPGLAQAQTEQA